jgi:hypothetical protein
LDWQRAIRLLPAHSNRECRLAVQLPLETVIAGQWWTAGSGGNRGLVRDSLEVVTRARSSQRQRPRPCGGLAAEARSASWGSSEKSVAQIPEYCSRSLRHELEASGRSRRRHLSVFALSLKIAAEIVACLGNDRRRRPTPPVGTHGNRRNFQRALPWRNSLHEELPDPFAGIGRVCRGRGPSFVARARLFSVSSLTLTVAIFCSTPKLLHLFLNVYRTAEFSKLFARDQDYFPLVWEELFAENESEYFIPNHESHEIPDLYFSRKLREWLGNGSIVMFLCVTQSASRTRSSN